MRFFVSNCLMLFLILLMLIQPVQAQAHNSFTDDALVCGNAAQKFEKKYQIKEHLLTTIANVETGRWNENAKQSLAWPWTVNAQGKGMFFNTKAEAVRKVKELQKQGVKSIDVGCMQINLAYHGNAFKSVEDALSPEKNVEYGAKFLTNLYKTKGKDWLNAAMAYHSSVPTKAQKYKKKIVSVYEKVKMASLQKSSAPLLNNTGKAKAEYVKNTINRAKKNARANANEWRAQKLAEYRRNKGLN